MRRILPLLLIVPLLLPGCTTTGGDTSLARAKAWIALLSVALQTADATYTGPDAAGVHRTVAMLAEAAAAFQQISDTATARPSAVSVLALAQQVAPLLSPRLGRTEQMYLSLAIAVAQAFVAGIPPPAETPAQAPVLAAPARPPA